MFFGKRRGANIPRPNAPAYTPPEPEQYAVAYENMLKGSKLTRRGKPIRQVAVVVSGTVKLVTSGDTVDRRTYDALIDAGVVAPARENVPDAPAAPAAGAEPVGPA